jgi:hypothetical protein
MITQTIKHWLGNLFAWWPWKRNAMAALPSQRRDGAIGSAHELLGRVSDDGTWLLPDTTFVAVKQENDGSPVLHSPFYPSSFDEQDNTKLSTTSLDSASCTPGSEMYQQEQSLLVVSSRPTLEQQLHFLRYLVERGLINEGFEEDKVPAQYHTKRHP